MHSIDYTITDSKQLMIKMYDKVHMYVRTCWDNYRCADKKEVERVINEVIKENPDETDWVKLGVKAKRRLMEE